MLHNTHNQYLPQLKSTKKILLTGGRSPTALFLARKFHKEGHDVFVAETSRLHICRFSNSVKKTFLIPSPRFSTKEFIQKLKEIIEEEKIDLYLPTYEEILYFSKEIENFPPSCRVFIPPFSILNELHNKWLFYTKLVKRNIPFLRTVLIQNEKDLENIDFTVPYALKPAYSRASQKVRKIDPSKKEKIKINIDAYNPWVAQEWLSGKKFCTYSLCFEGKVRAHCVYPVEYSIEGNSCLVFSSIEHAKIEKWVEDFVKEENFTGQIAFDFIEANDGSIYAIECNPRATSGLYLFSNTQNLDEIFFPDKEEFRVHASPGTSRQIAIGMLFYGWKDAYQGKKLLPFLKTFFSVSDVVFSIWDIKPFLSQPFVFASYWIQSKKWDLRVPFAFTFDSDWDNEHAENT